jgi:hypothetical protein
LLEVKYDLFPEFPLNRKTIFSIISFILLFSTELFAQKTSVLNLCAKKDGKPFILFTDDGAKAEELGFKKFKETRFFVRDFRVMVDNVPSNYFKPFEKDESCITVFRIPPGKKEIKLDFRSVSYTDIETQPLTMTFKPDLLHSGTVNIVAGPKATVKITQISDRLSLYQALDNAEVKNCSSECSVPVGVPVYFMIKSQDEKVKCPVKFELIVEFEQERKLNCYNPDLITKMLEEFVEKNSVLCRVNVEYAFFKVYGEGCIVSLESDKDGLNYQTPEMKLLPLDKQKFKYFWKINSEEKKPYTFSGDRKGAERTPAEDDIIEIIEERNF